MKEQLAANFDKIFLGIAALCLVAYLALGFMGNPIEANVSNVVTRAGEVDGRLSTDSATGGAAANLDKKVLAELALTSKADAFQAWASHRPTEYTFTEIIVEPVGPVTPETTWKHPAPKLTTAEAALSGVSIAWEAGKVSGESVKAVPVDGWVIRRKEGDGDWTQVNDTPLDKGTTSYTDSDVNPLTKYSYEVKAVTNKADEEYRGDRYSAASNSLTAETPDNRRQWLLFGIKGDGGEKKDSARIEVEVWHNDGWQKRAYNVTAGDPMGQKEKVRLGTERVDLDFETGLTFVGIEERDVEKVIISTRIKYDEKGNEIGEEEIRQVIPKVEQVLIAKGADGTEVVVTKRPKEDKSAEKEDDAGDSEKDAEDGENGG